MKITGFLSLALVVSQASAFAPQQRGLTRPSVAVFMSDEEAAAPAPAPPATPAPSGGKLVAIKEETVEFTAGMIGGAAGFALGGPVLGAIGAAAANYVSKMEGDASDIVSSVSKSAIQVYNYLLELDGKYEVLAKAQTSLENALEKLKAQETVDKQAVAKVESALASTKSKITEINDEYDLVGAGMTALGVVGDLVEQTIKKATELNKEYELTEKAKEALSGAVEKAKSATK